VEVGGAEDPVYLVRDVFGALSWWEWLLGLVGTVLLFAGTALLLDL
jgi:hypothetical protein